MVKASELGSTLSHAFAVDARRYGGGHAAALRLRESNLLSSGIGLPSDTSGNEMGGLRLGLNEAVRWGLTTAEMPELAGLIIRGLEGDDAESVAADVRSFRSRFTDLHFVSQS